MLTNKELAHKLEQLERKIEKHDEEIKAIFNAIRQLMTLPAVFSVNTHIQTYKA